MSDISDSLLADAPDISDTYRFPVTELSWRTINQVITDLVAVSTSAISSAVLHDETHGLVKAHAQASANLVLAYNYLDRWVEAYVAMRETEPF